MRFEGKGYHVHTSDEVENLFEDVPEALDATLEIAEKCEGFYIETGKYYLPVFPVPAGYTDYGYLYKLADEGFTERYGHLLTQDKSKYDSYRERFEYELGVIKKMGFEGYFLIVWDFINFAKQNDIPVGPGRGSGAGSMVLYCLHITEVDPMKYDLLFERFLNPERVSMPDIDTDIAESKRQLVIDYVSKKYGLDKVSQIITFGTFGAKSSIRDVARVYGLSPSESQKLTKLIPDDPKITIDKALKEAPEFVNMVEGSELYKKIVNIARKIEGLPRNRSIHASGICISRDEMTEYLPQIIMTDEDTGEKVMSTQYNMTECEEVGVIKFDFLGLRTLDVIDNAGRLIERKTGKRIKEADIPLNDPAVYAFLGQGNTAGVFQFESDGMTGLLKNMYADVKGTDTNEKAEEYFERLIAAVSLYRPGPMDEIPNYLKGMKTGEIHYDHEKLESILSKTYGILVYQEQIMRAVRVLAGFSTGQADTVRKAMGKKKIDIMNEYGEYFINGSEAHDKANPNKAYNIPGCIKNGIRAETASLIWDKMVKFAEYAFNKSHAAAYATLGAKTAWLACYYPLEYMTAILNSYITDNKKLDKYVKLCKDINIKISKPDVNISNEQFDIINDEIVFGLSGIKSVGGIAAKAIIDERSENGKYKSFSDFIVRIARRGSVNSSALTAMVYAGALDCFPGTRRAKIESIGTTAAAVMKAVKKEVREQLSLFDVLNIPIYEVQLPECEEFDEFTIAFKEEEMLGIFLKHPVEKYNEKLIRLRNNKKLNYSGEIEDGFNDKVVCLAGVIKDKKLSSYVDQRSGAGKNILKFNISDITGYTNCVMFGNDAVRIGAADTDKAVYYIIGRVKIDDFGTSVMVNEILTLDEVNPDIKVEEDKGVFSKPAFKKYAERLNKWRGLKKLNYTSELNENFNNKEVRLAGIIKNKKFSSYVDHKTGKNKYMLKFDFADDKGSVPCVIFGDSAIAMNAADADNTVYYILGRFKIDNFGMSVMVNKTDALK
jgi:DNA polymerase-3 subunit alpha